ncbi:MAG: methyltransferase domain-containing protein [bacterium]
MLTSTRVSLICPRCSATLDSDDEQLRCSGCQEAFPIVDGIPRLLDQDFYWGEIKQGDARKLVDDAKEVGWKTAVSNRFEESDSAWISILDWQRASWIPLLALPKESTVLDIGSGYGAITHALASHFDEVHSIEAIPERVEFTNTRLAQEGLDNVSLVQGSALQLPYPAGSFDAIIVNGVLEWIGDWDLEGSPRSAQLRFLRRLHSLLKPNGQLLVGIENRFGYVSVTGAIDHSGLPYTNLLPRPLATAALRLFANRHHRMVSASRSYRTYTYSERGYRRLFSEAQFVGSQSYWAEPGYNLPYRLAPLTRASVTETLTELQTEATMHGSPSLAGRVKQMLAKAGLFRQLVPEFVFILRKAGSETPNWDAVLPAPLRKNPLFRLTTQRFGTKTTVRAYTPQQPGVILKYSTPVAGSRERIADEHAELERMAASLAAHPSPSAFEVSTPLGSFEMGRQLLTTEKGALGEHVSLMLFRLPAEQRFAFLQTYLPRLAEVGATISSRMEPRKDRATAASWIEHAIPFVGTGFAARAHAIRRKYDRTSGHGDFNIENVLLDQETNRLTVIDWEYVRSGLPPLFDVFTLFLAVLAAVEPSPKVSAAEDPLLAQFHAAFFEENKWSALFKSCTDRARAVLGIEREELWDLFADSLILRVGYLVERKSVFSTSRIAFVGAIENWKSQFQL